MTNVRGTHDASLNMFPTHGGSGIYGDIMQGDTWVIRLPGQIADTYVHTGWLITALVDDPGQVGHNWGGTLPESEHNLLNEHLTRKALGSYREGDTLILKEKASREFLDLTRREEIRLENVSNEFIITKIYVDEVAFGNAFIILPKNTAEKTWNKSDGFRILYEDIQRNFLTEEEVRHAHETLLESKEAFNLYKGL